MVIVCIDGNDAGGTFLTMNLICMDEKTEPPSQEPQEGWEQ